MWSAALRTSPASRAVRDRQGRTPRHPDGRNRPVTTVPAALPGPVARWVAGARPRTLAAAAVPVAVGTAVGWWARSGAVAGAGPGAVVWWRAGCALVVALGLQVGTNYANDYSDGVRGADRARVGPLRLVA